MKSTLRQARHSACEIASDLGKANYKQMKSSLPGAVGHDEIVTQWDDYHCEIPRPTGVIRADI